MRSLNFLAFRPHSQSFRPMVAQRATQPCLRSIYASAMAFGFQTAGVFKQQNKRTHKRRSLQRFGAARSVVILSLWGSGGSKDAGRPKTQSTRRESLLAFVNQIRPSPDSGSGSIDVPAPVLLAMRQAVGNLLGSLPQQIFTVTISTRSDNLAQLMFSVLMTGYLFCNGWYRLQLANNLRSASPSLLSSAPSASAAPLAAAQKLRIQGEVVRYTEESGAHRVPALEYMEELEAELTALRRELSAQQAQRGAAAASSSHPVFLQDSYGNELLDYLKGLSAEQLTDLTDCASPDVLEAMNALVLRLVGEEGQGGEWGLGKNECTAPELGHLLCWLMAVGHQLREMEVRLGLTAALEATEEGNRTGWLGPDDGADDSPSSDWVPRLPPGR